MIEELKTLKNLEKIFLISMFPEDNKWRGTVFSRHDFREIIEKPITSTNNGFVNFADLRQEAIKWIKDFQKSIDRWEWDKNSDRSTTIEMKHLEQFIRVPPDNMINDIGNAKVLINWIKHFFNITEEDLK